MFARIKNSIRLAGFTAGLMYLFDPDLGRRRRALLNDQINHAVHKISRGVDVTLRDMENRLNGFLCELRKMFSADDKASDEIVVERVRSKLGRYTSHPAAIEVAAHDGCVTLRGPILASEIEGVIFAANSVAGVRRVENELEVHASAENIPALQGGRRMAGEPAEWMQDNWSPTARVLAGLAGGAMMVNSAVKRSLPAMIFGTGGFLLVVRALVNQPSQGIGARGQRSRRSTRKSEQYSVPAGANTPQSERTALGKSSLAGEREQASDEQIDEALAESFPASDAPSFTRR